MLRAATGGVTAALMVMTLGAGSSAAQGDALTADDEDLLVKVRLAGLWEGPISALIAQRTRNEKVREAGGHLSMEHAALDGAVQKAAAQLGVSLPNEPTAQQKGWMDDISGRSGEDADRTYANLARAAHGTVFSLCAKVRAGTRNDIVRTFAQQAVNAVMRHMTLLESTGLVRSTSLLVAPAANPVDPASEGNSVGGVTVVFGLLLGVAAVVGTFAALRWLGSYRRRGSRT
ncbi:DUF4142 domain-containing protein [Amycolatopsis suaedae]|uniref:DUF4142 domain-containing protein n=1 Tax=Amycolatopsis suaedae TaxID=2510978 RepID=UPI00196B1A7F|nr:DUF4142 domain-containing protein [Amycolatopsis suaedae]